MRRETRRDLATATTGAGLLAAGGALRHAGVRRAVRGGQFPKVHPTVFLRRGAKGRRLYAAGSAAGLAGLPALAVGAARLAVPDVEKRLKVVGLVGEQPRLPGARRALAVQPPTASRSRSWPRRHSLIGMTGGGLATPRKVPTADEFAEVTRQARALRTSAGTSRAVTDDEIRYAAERAVPQRLPRVSKADKEQPGFWREGLGGAAGALGGRAQTLAEPVPGKVRATQLGTGVAAGGLGSLAARAALGRKGDVLKPVVTPVAGGLAAAASLPLSNRYVARKYPGYEVTPYGVRRAKKAPMRPSSRARVVDARRGSLRGQIVPSDPVRKAEPLEVNWVRTHRRPRQLRPEDLEHYKKRAHGRPPWRYRPESLYGAVQRGGRRGLVGKADDRYLGARTPYGTQRLAVTAAGHPPVIGPLTAAAAAGRYAPPGQERKHAVRQWAMGSGAGVATGAVGAHYGARLANRSDTALRYSRKAVGAVHGAENKARGWVGMKPKPAPGSQPPGRLMSRVYGTRFGRPMATPRGKVGAAAGFLGVKALTGATLGQAAISMNQRDQTRYNRQHGISKALLERGQTKREKHELARKKRTSAALSAAGGTAGLTGLGLLAAGRKEAATTAGIVGGGLGGLNALLNSPIQRQEAKAIDPVRKIAPRVVHHGTSSRAAEQILASGKVLESSSGHYGPGAYVGNESLAREYARKRGRGKPEMVTAMAVGPPKRAGHHLERKRKNFWTYSSGQLIPVDSRRLSRFGPRHAAAGAGVTAATAAGYEGHRRSRRPERRPKGAGIPVVKADSIELRNDKGANNDLLSRYGDRGPLPKTLPREERMRAYEARYVRHGGHKANRWSQRAETGEKVKNAGLGVATAGGAGWLASRTRSGGKLAGRISPRTRHHMDTLAVGGGVAGGAGEIYSGYANRRQSSYANSPGGVAASALRRMRAYTPEES